MQCIREKMDVIDIEDESIDAEVPCILLYLLKTSRRLAPSPPLTRPVPFLALDIFCPLFPALNPLIFKKKI
jgi:hypothetical protein